MRSRWLGGLMGVGLMLAGAPTMAVATPTARVARVVVGFMPVGTLSYIWTGDPGRGCAAEGLCGVVGALQVATGNSSSASSGPGPSPIEIQDSSTVARVEQTGPDGAQHTCVDPVPYDAQFTLRHGPTGALRAVSGGFAAQPPSPGRCAGPTPADLAGLVLPARKLGHRGYDLSGSVSFGAGPFAVTVVSTIHALFSPTSFSQGSSPGTTQGPRLPQPRAALAEQADVAYRVISADGQFTASFSGLAQPFCVPLDACGTTGAVSLSLASQGATLHFSGLRVVKRRVGSRQALIDLRAGRLRLNAGFGVQVGGQLTGTLTGAGSAPCRDTVSVSSLSLNGSPARGVYRVTLGQSGPGFGPDDLRTRCPGPGSSDIVGARPLAAGVLSPHDLGASRLSVVLSAAGLFGSTAYAGTRSGSVILTLARTHVSAGTRHVHIFGGQVF